MIQALNEAAWSSALDPEGLWRASCAWTSQGATEHGEWLHEMAVTLLDIEELAEAPEPVVFDTTSPYFARTRQFGDLRSELLREPGS